jgi:LPS-assembly protein
MMVVFELAVPVYLNLAPNYDATLTPSYMSKRGAMFEGEFRYMTENFGSGTYLGCYLPKTKNMMIKIVKIYIFT